MDGDLRKTSKEKDIGVVIDDRLEYSDHLAEKVNKAKISGYNKNFHTS